MSASVIGEGGSNRRLIYLVDQVTGSGGFSGVDVPDDNDVDVRLLLTVRNSVSNRCVLDQRATLIAIAGISHTMDPMRQVAIE